MIARHALNYSILSDKLNAGTGVAVDGFAAAYSLSTTLFSLPVLIRSRVGEPFHSRGSRTRLRCTQYVSSQSVNLANFPLTSRTRRPYVPSLDPAYSTV